MNIAFLYYSEIIPERGGVQRATSVLADFFEQKGHQVYYLALHHINRATAFSKRQYFFPTIDQTIENESFLKDFLQGKKIDILINQSGIRPDVSKYAILAKSFDVKVITVINNSILSGIQNFKSLYKSIFKAARIGWVLPLTDLPVVKTILLELYRIKYRSHYRNICNNSDRVVQLSSSFRYELDFMGAGTGSEKIVSIPNPVSFTPEAVNFEDKKKELLFVGRIDTIYKRVDLLLEIWHQLFRDFPQWHLRIVGGGEELEQIKQLAEEKKLERIFFEGFQDPRPYFRNASIFCMTSSSESFGIVLIEAMNYGTIPFAFNSYASVTDIIDHSKNGMLIPPFDCSKYAKELSVLMNDFDKCQQMSASAMEKATEFSVDKIGGRWLHLFDELLFSN